MLRDDSRSDAPTRARLRVLGEFGLEAAVGAREVGSTAQEVLAALAVTGRPRDRARLAVTLWPGRGADALEVLNAAVSELSRAVPGVVLARGDRLELSPDVEVDLARALRGLQPGAEELPGGAEHLIDPLSQDVLPEWPQEWVTPERERFRRLRLYALESLCRRLTQAGRHAVAIEAGLLVVVAEPLRETARRALIEAHLAAGNVAEAVSQQQAFAALRSQLGCAPSIELSSFLPPSPAWPVLHVRRPVHAGDTVGRGLRPDLTGRRQ